MKTFINKIFKMSLSTVLAFSLLVPASYALAAEDSVKNDIVQSSSSSDADTQKMVQDLYDSISKDAKAVGKPQIIEVDASELASVGLDNILAASTSSLVTWENPLQSWVTFYVGHWGSYREFDGNKVAVSYKFTCPEGWDSKYSMSIGLYEYGQQYLNKGYAIGTQENVVYSFTSGTIKPVNQSYRFRYESNTVKGITVFIVALPYYN